MTFTLEMWKAAVARGDTDSGFQEWAENGEKRVKKEAELREKAAGYKLYRFSRYEIATICQALGLWKMFVNNSNNLADFFSVDHQRALKSCAGTWKNEHFDYLNAGQVDMLQSNLLAGRLEPEPSGYLLTYPDGKVATITRKEPGDKCALIVKELFANEQTNQSAEA